MSSASGSSTLARPQACPDEVPQTDKGVPPANAPRTEAGMKESGTLPKLVHMFAALMVPHLLIDQLRTVSGGRGIEEAHQFMMHWLWIWAFGAVACYVLSMGIVAWINGRAWSKRRKAYVIMSLPVAYLGFVGLVVFLVRLN